MPKSPGVSPKRELATRISATWSAVERPLTYNIAILLKFFLNEPTIILINNIWMRTKVALALGYGLWIATGLITSKQISQS